MVDILAGISGLIAIVLLLMIVYRNGYEQGTIDAHDEDDDSEYYNDLEIVMEHKHGE